MNYCMYCACTCTTLPTGSYVCMYVCKYASSPVQSSPDETKQDERERDGGRRIKIEEERKDARVSAVHTRMFMVLAVSSVLDRSI